MALLLSSDSDRDICCVVVCVSHRQSSEESVIIIVVVVVAAATAVPAVSSSSVACRGKDKVFTRPWHIHSNCFVFRGCACCLFVCLKRWQQRGSNMFKLLHTNKVFINIHSTQQQFPSSILSQNATSSFPRSFLPAKLTQ